MLFSFQSEALAPLITYDNYFGFMLQVVLALGISFELPLIIILLSVFGILTPAALNKFRRFAVVLACCAGAILSPGPDVISMIMMTIPLLLLYEVGFAGSVVVQRRRKRRAMNATSALVLVAVLFGAGATRAEAQVPVKPPVGGQHPRNKADSLRQGLRRLGDSTRCRTGWIRPRRRGSACPPDRPGSFQPPIRSSISCSSSPATSPSVTWPTPPP